MTALVYRMRSTKTCGDCPTWKRVARNIGIVGVAWTLFRTVVTQISDTETVYGLFEHRTKIVVYMSSVLWHPLFGPGVSVFCLLAYVWFESGHARFHEWRDGGVVRPPHQGPFPPFSLGGSLELNDFFDFMSGMKAIQARVWTSVKNYRDVEIDWSAWPDTDFIVDVSMTGGKCRAALLDVDNDAIVAIGEWMNSRRNLPPGKWQDAPKLPSVEDIARGELIIPKSAGRRGYRLMVQPAEKETTTFWVAGEITFPIHSLGGKYIWIAPTKPGPRPVVDSKDVEIDWAQIRDPINSVIAELFVVVSDPREGDVGRGRVLVWDVNESQVVVQTSWIDKRWHAHRSKPWSDPKRRLQFLSTNREPVLTLFHLPRLKGGKKKYRLLMEVEDLGTRIMASGRLLLRH